LWSSATEIYGEKGEKKRKKEKEKKEELG